MLRLNDFFCLPSLIGVQLSIMNGPSIIVKFIDWVGCSELGIILCILVSFVWLRDCRLECLFFHFSTHDFSYFLYFSCLKNIFHLLIPYTNWELSNQTELSAELDKLDLALAESELELFTQNLLDCLKSA